MPNGQIVVLNYAYHNCLTGSRIWAFVHWPEHLLSHI